MNEKYVPYYKWKKLSKADKDEFNYKFEAKLDRIKNETKNLDVLFILTLIYTSLMMLVTIQGVAFLGLPPSTTKLLLGIGMVYFIIIAFGTNIKESYYKYKIKQWLESKEL